MYQSDALANTRKLHQSDVVFLFTGQGAQYARMGSALYATQPVFKQALEQCDSILKGHGISLLDVLYHGKAEDTLIHQTVYAQPAIFSLEYALAELWKSWGIKPSLALGHSVGEYVAACIAGVFSLEDGLRLIAERGKLIQSLPENGMMAVVFGGYEKALHAIQPYHDTVSIAAVNSRKTW